MFLTIENEVEQLEKDCDEVKIEHWMKEDEFYLSIVNDINKKVKENNFKRRDILITVHTRMCEAETKKEDEEKKEKQKKDKIQKQEQFAKQKEELEKKRKRK